MQLSPRAFDLLGILLESRPRAFTKAELRDRLWPDTAVADTSLAKLVAELRRAIGDDAREPRFIRTVHRHGYAFCGVADYGPAVPGSSSCCCLLWEGREIGLAEGDNFIGRAPDCVVRVGSPRASRHHARIRVTGGEAVVDDLGSKNGTFVGGRRLTGAVSLKQGDEIQVGPAVMIFAGFYGTGSTESEA